jgi:dipeptidyl aminopeptidase/acylaminoacyl peptidase
MQNPIVQLMFHYQVLAGAGYTVVLPNPRGSIGYGEKFTAMSVGDWGDGPFSDIEACADDALRRGLADPRRQYLGGYSYGGYMSAWAVGHTTRFRAAAIGAPVTNLVSQAGAADIGPWLARMVTGDPWSAPELFRAQSPLTHAPAMRTPVLLYVNEGDLRCPPSQCDELYAALKWRRREVEYVRYPGGSHLSFLTMAGVPSQNEDRARRILRLCARHGGEPYDG